jgi:hypothetical protein
MEKEEKEMTEKDSLQLITSMINKARNRFNETGILYLIYGWIIFICSLVQFIALYFFKSQNAYYIWYLTWAAVIYQVIYLRKKRASQKTRTYTDEIVGYVWLVFIICISLLIFLQLYLKSIATINPSILVLYGMPTFLSGVILKSNPLKIGGICCWLLAIVSIFILPEFQLLIIAVAVVVAWIIPGYLLKQKFKKEN